MRKEIDNEISWPMTSRTQPSSLCWVCGGGNGEESCWECGKSEKWKERGWRKKEEGEGKKERGEMRKGERDGGGER